MGQAGTTLKVTLNDADIYYHVSRKHLDMIYRIQNYKYQFGPNGCYRTPLDRIDSPGDKLAFENLEVKFVRAIRDLGFEGAKVDIETKNLDCDKQLEFTIISYIPDHYDARVVICS